MTEARTHSQRPSEAPRPMVEDPGLSTLEQPEPGTFEPNRWLRWLYTRFFRHMGIDEKWSHHVRESAAQGIVVYVMRSISVLDFLCLDYLVKRFRLPLVRFVNDLGLWILEPFGRGGRRLRLRRQVPQEEALAKVIHEHESALLFLRRPPGLGEKRTGQGLDVDLIRTLVEQARKVDRPILLVPQTFVWTKRPPSKKPTLVDLVFGPSEWPGRVRVFLRFLLNYRNAQLRSGEPFDLSAFLDEHQDLTDAEAADRIRYAVLRRMERERQIVLGPAKKTAGRIREELIRSPRVRVHIERHARDNGISIEKAEREADRELRKLCAMMDPNAINLFARILTWVFTRIYDGFVLDQEGLERVREAARRGPLILLPSHKSHVDYLVLSYVMAQNAVSPPLIAAGDNLSFFPIGPFLRRSGAFFIRRSFRGRRLYTALVDAYLRKILVEGWNVEFFMEGGRSRTGKLLPPKLGLLSMVVDAGLKLPSSKVSFVPISVGYERVIEQGAYAHELGGGEKEPESVGGLLRTSTVLRSRYGRLYIQFGEIFELDELLAEAARLRGDDEPDDLRELRPAERRALINRIAHRVTHEIDRVTTVTPAALVATAVMSHRKRGMTRDDLKERAARLLAALSRFGARIAKPVLEDEADYRPGQILSVSEARALLRADALEETIALFADAKLLQTDEIEGERVLTVPSDRRIALEYHENTLISFFVPSALISAALLALSNGEEAGPVEDRLRERVANLSRLFKYEFMFRADATFDEIFDDALRGMIEAGEVARDGDGLRPVEGSLVPVYAELLRSYFEAYRLTALSLDGLPQSEVKKKDWVKQTLARGRRLFATGEVELEEALSRQKIENALSAFHDLGLVKVSRESVERGAALADAEILARWDRRLGRYLRR